MKKLLLLVIVMFVNVALFGQVNLEPHESDELLKKENAQTQPTSPNTKPTPAKKGSGGLDNTDVGNEQKSVLPGYELEVEGNGAFYMDNLMGIDFYDFNNQTSLMGLLRHTSTNPGTMYLSNFQGELQMYSGENEITLYSAGIKALEADENQDINIGNPIETDARLNVAGKTTNTGPTIDATVKYTGNSDVRAVRAVSRPNPGWGVGGEFTGGYQGLRGIADGTDSPYSTYGVYGSASSDTSNTVYGIYGTAFSGTDGRAYGVYASGDLKVTSQLFIGTSTTQEDAAAGFELIVDGESIMEEVKVELSGNWPDYVFKEGYDLMPLDEVESFINENGHLPNIPSAKAIEEDGGFRLGDTQKKVLEKVEELTLYMIDLKKENEILKRENEEIKALIKELKNK